jgi:putative flippase GtrA
VNVSRIVRFALVGGVNTCVYYGCYLALVTQLPYLAAHVCAFVIAMVCSYFLNCYVTFRTRPRWRTFLLFPLSNLTNFVLTTVGLRIAVEHFHANRRLAPLEVAVVAIPITYVTAHYIMLGRRRSEASTAGDRTP